MDPMAIHRAAEEGDLHRVRQLMEAGASMDSRGKLGRTPILAAAFHGHHAVVEFLINCKLYPGTRNSPMLHIDVENEGAIGLFLQHDLCKITLLHIASLYGWVDIAQIIIEKGSGSDMVNAATIEGMTPLLMAVSRGREDVAALLLRSWAAVNRRDMQGWTALHWSVDGGYVRLVKLLLQEEGLDLNPRDQFGNTPLHMACSRRNPNREEIMKQLLTAGADVNLNNRNGVTPLSLRLKEYNPNLEVINLCVQHGAFFRDRDYGRISESEDPVLRGYILKNVDLCTQSVVNKFSRETLPALYSSPYFASMLPSMDNLMLNTSQKDELKNFVRRDIQQNKF